MGTSGGAVGPLAQIDGILPPKTAPSSPNSSIPSSIPAFSAADRFKFIRIFVGFQPMNGLLSSEKARDIFVKSKLPIEKLSQIWNLADTQRRGALDQADFVIGMFFIQLALSQPYFVIPTSLPSEIYEQASGASTKPMVPAHITGGGSSYQNQSPPAPEVVRSRSASDDAPTHRHAGSELERMSFSGAEDITVFMQDLQRVAFSQGRQRDDDWRVDYLTTCLTGSALLWYMRLEEDTRYSWMNLSRALLLRFSPIDAQPPSPPAASPPSRRLSLIVPQPPSAPVTTPLHGQFPPVAARRTSLPAVAPLIGAFALGGNLNTKARRARVKVVSENGGDFLGYLNRAFLRLSELPKDPSEAAIVEVPLKSSARVTKHWILRILNSMPLTGLSNRSDKRYYLGLKNVIIDEQIRFVLTVYAADEIPDDNDATIKIWNFVPGSSGELNVAQTTRDRSIFPLPISLHSLRNSASGQDGHQLVLGFAAGIRTFVKLVLEFV
ncbi:hypothetical protein FRB94_011048 [Tulasnella sp. JGI-2019a]|nr:hypothetical protein FRB94_011048 [Tulasnella sp. JGI-2019a]